MMADFLIKAESWEDSRSTLLAMVGFLARCLKKRLLVRVSRQCL